MVGMNQPARTTSVQRYSGHKQRKSWEGTNSQTKATSDREAPGSFTHPMSEGANQRNSTHQNTLKESICSPCISYPRDVYSVPPCPVPRWDAGTHREGAGLVQRFLGVCTAGGSPSVPRSVPCCHHPAAARGPRSSFPPAQVRPVSSRSTRVAVSCLQLVVLGCAPLGMCLVLTLGLAPVGMYVP